MKKLGKRILTGIFIMVLAFIGTMPQGAGLLPGAAGEVCAETTYTVFIYSGKEGSFAGGETVKKMTGLKYGEKVTVSLEDLDLKVEHPDEYYVRGLKIAGHDNDELSSMLLQSYTFDIEEDTSFSVSYGMAGGMVRYTVNYVDGSGNTLRSSDEYYGMAGDKPVVAFRLIEGYLPDDYNLTKTLSDDESDNVFTFTYHRAEGTPGGETEEGDEDNGGNDNGNAGNNGNANAGGNANANGAGAAGDGAATANIGDNGTPLANVTDLDDNKTPMAPGSDEKSEGLLSGMTGLMGGIVGAGILIALLLLYLVLRKKKGEEE